jgi:ABC-type nitrate/sulfonate/bicarbonate transport system substrate-binding protein
MRHRHTHRWMTTALAFGLLAAACGGEAGTEPAEAEPDGAAAEDTADGDAAAGQDFGEGPLRVLVSESYDLPMIGAEAAEYLGLYDEMGLDVEVIAGQEAVPGLASGDVDVAIASPNRFIGAIAKGLEATIVGPTIDVWGQYFIVRSDLGIDKVEDFPVGGKMGISRFGSAGHYSAVKVADTLGFSEDDYELVTMGGLDSLMAGLRNGTIDAFAWSAQAAFSLEADGSGTVLGSVGDVIGPNPLDVITVLNSTIEERPDAVRAFCEAYYDAQETFKNDPEMVKDVFINEWDFEAEVTPRIIDAGLPLLSTSSEMDPEMFANMAEATAFTLEDVGDITAEQVEGMYTNCSDL